MTPERIRALILATPPALRPALVHVLATAEAVRPAPAESGPPAIRTCGGTDHSGHR